MGCISEEYTTRANTLHNTYISKWQCYYFTLEQDAFFIFSLCTQVMFYFFLSWLAFEIVTSVFPTGTEDVFFFFLFQILLYRRSPNKQTDDFKWGAEESALLAACIEQDHYGLSGGQSNLLTLLTTVKIYWSLFYSTETLKVIFMTWYELWIQQNNKRCVTLRVVLDGVW